MTAAPAVPFVDLRALHAGLREEVLAAFARVLDCGGYVQGAEVAALEGEFARMCGAPHAVAASNGTTALHLALAAVGAGPGDEVITVANTFIATAEAISMAGARPVFVDIEPGGFTMDAGAFRRAITPRTKAVIPVHLYGELAEMASILAIAREHGIAVIEDACQAHGAIRDGAVAGTLGDVGCFSFYPTKNLGTVGEGGMILTRHAALAERMTSLRDHGQRGRHNHAEPGFNYRMPELQAAAVRVFLPHLAAWNRGRIAAAAAYDARLKGLDVTAPRFTDDGSHVYHLYVVRTRQRDRLQAFLAERGIGTAVHYPAPIHLQRAYERSGLGAGSLPHTERAVEEILSLPMHPGLEGPAIETVCEAIRDWTTRERGTDLHATSREPIAVGN